MKIRAGELRENIVLVSPTGAIDTDFGGLVGATVDVATVWAKAAPLKSDAPAGGGKIQIEHGQIDAVTGMIFFIRFRTDVGPGMFVRYRNKTYKILYLVEVEFRAFLRLDCEIRDANPA